MSCAWETWSAVLLSLWLQKLSSCSSCAFCLILWDWWTRFLLAWCLALGPSIWESMRCYPRKKVRLQASSSARPAFHTSGRVKLEGSVIWPLDRPTCLPSPFLHFANLKQVAFYRPTCFPGLQLSTATCLQKEKIFRLSFPSSSSFTSQSQNISATHLQNLIHLITVKQATQKSRG